MEAFITSATVVAFAEIGDKTMLLALVLATRFRQPLQIILGILLATLVNHALAAFVGETAASILGGTWFRFAVATSFIVMAAWTLIPDKFEDEQEKQVKWGAFLTTLIAFFFVEMGDKTQIATVALGARFESVLYVTAGTTLGMLLANAPAVYLGHELLDRVPLATVRLAAAILFLAIGLWMFVQIFWQ